MDYEGLNTIVGDKQVPMKTIQQGDPVYHVVFSYTKGDGFNLHGKRYTVPIANRVILDYDTIHKDIVVSEDFKKYIEKNAKHIISYNLSGYNAIIDPELTERRMQELGAHYKKVKEEKKVSKEAKISVTIFLIAMVGIVLLGAVSGLVPTLADGSKLPLTTVIEIFMLVAAAAMILLTKLDSNKVLDQPVFRTGMFAVVLAFGLCWLVNTFIGDQSSFITDNMSALTNKYPWIFIVAVFIVGAITTSQSSTTMIMIPIGIALGLPANVIVAGWIACSSNYFIPASGQCVAALAFDSAGTTKIGKFVLNHSYMIPGLVCTVVSVVVALLIGAVVF